jgi:outer membrane lipase/esterase
MKVFTKKILTLSIGALLAGTAATHSSAQAYSNMIIFGDSLADGGQFIDPGALLGIEGVPTDSRLRFTNRSSDGYYMNPYPTILGTNLGFSNLGPSQPATFGAIPGPTSGYNYAVGGYLAENVYNSIVAPGGAVTPPVALNADTTVPAVVNDGFLAGDNASQATNAIVVISSGGNDIRASAIVDFDRTDPTAPVPTGFTIMDTDTINTNMITAADFTSRGAAAMTDAGAGLVIVPNLPDIGDIPETSLQAGIVQAAGGSAADFIAARTNATNAYNASLAEKLNAIGGNVIMPDFNSFFADMVANPTEFGLANIDQSAACYNAQDLPQIYCVEDADRGFNTTTGTPSPFSLLFNDGIHPTIAGSTAAAQLIQSTIEASDSATQVAEFAATPARMQADVITQELRERHHKGNRSDAIISDLRYEQSETSNQKILGATIGAVKVFSDKLEAGAALGYNSVDVSTAGRTGTSFEGNNLSLNVFAKTNVGKVYISGIASANFQDYDSVERKVEILSAVKSNKGNTKGKDLGVTIEVGTNVKNSSNWEITPFAQVDYHKTTVDGYAESGTDYTGVSYGDIEHTSAQAAIGVRSSIDTEIKGHGVNLWGEAKYERDLIADNGSLRITPSNGVGGFTVTPNSNKDDSIVLSAGLSYAKNNTTIGGFITTDLRSDDSTIGGGLQIEYKY